MLAGQYFDAETGLHYNYHRYYDPATGRYLTADPIGLAGGINLYNYVGGNPVNLVDPYGLKYAEQYAASGAIAGTGIVAAGSIVVDAATGGLNILATPAELAGGAALGSALGYGIGSIADWWMGEGNGDSCQSSGSESTPGMPDPDDDDPIIFRGKKVNKDLANRLGIDRHRLRESIHKIKYNAGHGGRDNVNITRSGNVFSQKSGEYIGNVFDELTFR
ncbi:RHS repeat-associated core domain-containing protein [Desulfosarcina cetonica]